MTYLVVVAGNITALGAAAVLLWRWLGPLFKAHRALFGEVMPDGTKIPGALSDIAAMKATVESVQQLAQHTAAELTPNHGSSVKDAVNQIRVMQHEATITIERHYAEALARDSAQDQRLDRIEETLIRVTRRGAIAVGEIQHQTAAIAEKLDTEDRP